ncbi:MAG: carboxypeptidase-like regulatory domain-containing protein [Acidobacteriaceae bacterium]
MLLASAGYAQQGSQATLNGTVTDPSGAVVAGAVVTATEMDTNVSNKAVTTGAGVYTFPALPPGRYKIATAHEGFQTAGMTDIELRVGQMLTVNVKLQMGQGSEKVVVSGDEQLLETSTSQLSHYVTSAELTLWPLNDTGGDRDIQQFIFTSLPGTQGNPFTGTINGGQSYTNEVYLEGVTLGTFDTSELHPSEDAIKEFNLQVGSMGAQYNGGGTAVSNYSIRSGTNALHGTAFEFLQNEDLNANSYTNKQFGRGRPRDRTNSFGGTIGGPVFIPKIYDGRNKTFFYVSYEHDIVNNFSLVGTTSVPTPAMAAGDLSGFLNPALTQDPRSGQPATTGGKNPTPVVDILGRPVIYGQVYDPATTRELNAGQVDPTTGLVATTTGDVRDPFVNNQIPASRFDSAAALYMKLPLPTDYSSNMVVNNVPTVGYQPTFSQTNLTIKLDHQLTAKDSLSFLFVNDTRLRSLATGGTSTWGPVGDSPLDPWAYENNPGKVFRINNYWAITPRLFNRLGLGYNRFTATHITPFSSQNWGSTFGIGNIANAGFPIAKFSGAGPSLGSRTDQLGSQENGSGFVNSSYVGIDQLSISKGAHQITAGTEWRLYHSTQVNNTFAPYYNFPNAMTDDGSTTTTYSGNSFASFLLGQVGSTGTAVYLGNQTYNRPEVGTFIQDDWKVNQRLTLNLGLRWEIIGGITEAHGQMSTMNPFTPNPGAGGLPGALQFATQLGVKGFEHADWGLILPRFGFAYEINSKTVVRGGFGVNTQAPEGGPEYVGQIFNPPPTWGYSGNLQINQGTNPQPFGDMAVANLRSPYPSFHGTLPDYDPTMANGYGPPQYVRPDGANPTYVENYNFGFERDLGHKTIAQVNYVGNIGKRIYASGLDQMNQLPVSDIAKYGDALQDPVSAHPNVPIPYAGFNRNNSVAQAIAPFPQYGGGSMFQYDFNHVGWSRYDAMQATVTRQVSNGFNVVVAYTWSKMMTNTNSNCSYSNGSCSPVQDVYHPQLEKAVGLGIDIPQQLKITTFYMLPVGKGRMFSLHGPMDWVFGGWTVSGNAIYQSGSSLQIVDSSANNGIFSTTRPNFTGLVVRAHGSGPINIRGHVGPQYLNRAAFAHVPTTCSLVAPGTACHNIALTTGDVPSALGGIQGPGYATENASLQKNFFITADKSFQFRADSFNLFNRVLAGNPITDINNPSFGQIIGAGGPRIVQVSGRFTF